MIYLWTLLSATLELGLKLVGGLKLRRSGCSNFSISVVCAAEFIVTNVNVLQEY